MNSVKRSDSKNIEDIIALTPMQEAMLVHYLKDPHGSQYLEQFSLDISGEIRREPFEKAWNTVIRTNPALRTVFRWEKLDHPVQMVLKEYVLQPVCHDLSSLKGKKRKERLDEIKAELKSPITTGSIDLKTISFKVSLCRMTKTHNVMIITNHHILYDGWSNGIILKEFFSAYHAYRQGRSPVEPVKTRFREYIKWIAGQDKAKQASWWQRYLKGFEGNPELSIKTARADRQPQKAGSVQFPMFEDHLKENNQRLENLCAEYNITAASLLYAAWGILLQRYNNTGDVVFGTTVSGRSAKVGGIEEMVGLFINTLPLRVECSGGETIRQLLENINRTLLEREAHESTPLVEIKEYSQCGGEEELFDTLIAIENYPLDSRLNEMAPGLSIRSFNMEEQTHYDLS
ncbi:MAG: non-ribosomal peptide synthetase, partial [bacterium]|nr:non-ribosomal peptide synthetase [bacterium]